MIAEVRHRCNRPDTRTTKYRTNRYCDNPADSPDPYLNWCSRTQVLLDQNCVTDSACLGNFTASTDQLGEAKLMEGERIHRPLMAIFVLGPGNPTSRSLESPPPNLDTPDDERHRPALRINLDSVQPTRGTPTNRPRRMPAS